MSDIIERAEAALEVFPGVPVFRELVAALKVARAQRDEFRAQLEHSERETERLHMIAELIAAYRKANPEDIAHRIYVDIEGILNGECDD